MLFMLFLVPMCVLLCSHFIVISNNPYRTYVPPAAQIRTRFDPSYGEQEGGRDIYPDEAGVYNIVQAKDEGSGGTGGSACDAPADENMRQKKRKTDKRGVRRNRNDDGPSVSQLMTVRAAPMQHTIPCVGFVVQESERPGRLRFKNVQPLVEAHKDELKAQLGLRDANKLYAVLKNMHPDDGPFVFPDGTCYRC